MVKYQTRFFKEKNQTYQKNIKESLEDIADGSHYNNGRLKVKSKYIKQIMLKEEKMRLFNKKEVSKEEEFRAKFMELQTGIISLCLEFTNSDVDYIYAYASMEESSYMFNAFFKKNDEVLRIEEINEDHDLAWEFLDLGIEDLKKIKK